MIKLRYIFILLVFALMGCIGNSYSQTQDDGMYIGGVKKDAGSLVSPSEKCIAKLQINEMGGFLSLYLCGASATIQEKGIDDVTGVAWLDDNALIYTVSPIYGIPGIYLFNCDTGHVKRIVTPKTFNKSYPDGADYFELTGLSILDPKKIYFYYASDVDSVDFEKLRTKEHIYELNLNDVEY